MNPRGAVDAWIEVPSRAARRFPGDRPRDELSRLNTLSTFLFLELFYSYRIINKKI